MRSLALCMILACGPTPTPTGATCPDPDPYTLTWDSFGHDFMTRYCTWCHDRALTRDARNGAPIYHDYNTLEYTRDTMEHVDWYAGYGPDAQNDFMPPGRCPT